MVKKVGGLIAKAKGLIEVPSLMLFVSNRPEGRRNSAAQKLQVRGVD